MSQHPLRSWIPTVGAVLAVAALVVGAFLFRSPPETPARETNPPKTQQEPKSPRKDATSTPLRGSSKTIRKTVEPPPERKTSESDRALADLKLRRGKQAREWWAHWKDHYEKELAGATRQLGELLELTPGQTQSVHALLATEEAQWKDTMDALLQPAFEEGTPPDFAVLNGAAYRSKIDALTGETDARIRSLLTGEQYLRYAEWRAKHNRSRYFWSEGGHRD